MTKILYIGLGGGIGSILRYVVSGFIQSLSKSFSFPFGTFAVNFIGCLVIGFLSYLAGEHGLFNENSRAFVFVGMLGGFTTFSTFANESMNLMNDGENILVFANIAGHIVLGLAAVWLGRSIAYIIWR